MVPSNAYMLPPEPAADPTYTTPFAAVTNPGFFESCGSGVCHRISPVTGFKADQYPLVTVMPANGPVPLNVTGLRLELASAT